MALQFYWSLAGYLKEIGSIYTCVLEQVRLEYIR